MREPQCTAEETESHDIEQLAWVARDIARRAETQGMFQDKKEDVGGDPGLSSQTGGGAPGTAATSSDGARWLEILPKTQAPSGSGGSGAV